MYRFDRIKRTIENIFFSLIDSIVFLTKRTSGDSVLLVRLDEIGDFTLWLDSAKEFKKIYPDSKIILLGNKTWVDLARSLPYWDEVLSLDCRKFLRNPFYRLHSLFSIRKIGIQIAIHPAFSRQVAIGDSVIHKCSAEERIGFSSNSASKDTFQKYFADQWYTHLVPSSNENLMELQRNAEFMKYLGLKDFKADAPVIPFVKKYHSGLSDKLPNRYYIIVPGAGRHYREWPASSFVVLTERIFKTTQMTGIICGGLKEVNLSHRIAKESSAPLVDLSAKTDLLGLLEIIRKASFLVGNETGAIHIASAVKTPSLCILGGGHYGRFLPYDLERNSKLMLPRYVVHKTSCFGCNWNCEVCDLKNEVANCIKMISINNVWEELESLLKVL
jgi:ADP-heptose:LPS heptosyltransferase